ncbi:MAG: sigma-54 dependent transcriptional regulator [Proteobacteria bacterium]|nr:sigma-54 dependent transcriptional regulator [Pseudomonadota bacterium]MBU1714486.1 sigma-54 dependent transcriptional regulator [Pseudomonadota bacterium]
MKQPLYPYLPVLLVDDEEAWLRSFSLTLRATGINNILTCQDSRQVKNIMAQQEIGTLVLDLTMPYLSGEELLPQIVQEQPEVPVIIITGLDLVDTAVKCMKLGAFDYYTKVSEDTRLIAGVKRAIDLGILRRENASLKKHVLEDCLDRPEAFAHIITHNKAMRSIFQYAEAISHTCEPVLITGDTGVGKELIARALHILSQRKGRLVPVNIAGLDENMFADTLFGHRKGAFTGADQARPGLIEQAAGGSLFLDEIGELQPASQVKLLRLLQEREYLPLGADLAKRTDCRMIFATQQNLEALQRAGNFRKDLFYRLRTHHIHIPPLQNRRDDLPLLVDYFADQAAQKLDRKKPNYPKELISLLATYDFPGNIRELQNMIFDAISQCPTNNLSMAYFKSYIYQRGDGDSGKDYASTQEGETPFKELARLPAMKEAGYLLAIEALNRAGGNQTIAAEMLGITRQALNWRLKQKDK